MNTQRFTSAAVLTLALMSGSVGNAYADSTTSAPTSATTMTYAEQLAAYKIAMDNYKVAMEQYNVTWKKTLEAYKAALATWTKDGKSSINSLKSKRDAIGQTFKAAIQAANRAYALAMTSARTADQKNAAKSARTSAINEATAARNVALDALQATTSANTKPVAPVKPAEPVKPIAPVKTQGSTKVTATTKASSSEKKDKKNN